MMILYHRGWLNHLIIYRYNKEEAENKCKIISSRGILKSCGIISINPVSSIKYLKDYDNIEYRLKYMNYGTTIYVCSSALKNFISKLLPTISTPFILVSGDCDETMPYDVLNEKEFKSFIQSDKVIHWYLQNCVITHPKITGIPIGLDYHTMSENDHDWGTHMSPLNQEKMLISLARESKPFYNRNIKIYSNCHFTVKSSKYGYDRKDAIERIDKNLVYYEPSKINRFQSWIKQKEFTFVLSPHGNGLDCHRTWEALALGCIPIVKTSKINHLYEELPVLILSDWSDVSLELLNNTVYSFKNKNFNYEKLNLEYWINIIKNIK